MPAMVEGGPRGPAASAPGPRSTIPPPASRPPSPHLPRLLAVALLLAPAVRADDPLAATQREPPQVLPPWTIVESVPRTLQPGRTDYFASTLGPSSVVSAADWSGRGVTTLAEALRRTPGLILQESFGGFEPPRFSIRGSGLDSAPTSRGVALLVDGLPLARADGSFHTGLFDPQLFPRLEVYRGTLHMALTPAVLGGVLNAATLDAGTPAGVRLMASGGDFGTARLQASYRGHGVGVASSFQTADGYRDHSSQHRSALQAAAELPLAPAARLELSAYAANAAYDVPGPLTLADAMGQPESVSAAVTRDQPRRDSTLVRAAAQVKAAAGEGEGAAGLAVLQLRDDFYQLQANGETVLDARAVTGHATAARRLALGGVEHEFLARAIFTTGNDTVDRYLNVLGRRGGEFAAYETHAETLALNFEDVVPFTPTFSAGAGLTALHGRRELTGRDPTPALRTALVFDDCSPRLGMRWSPDPRLSFHGAVSRGIEPPTFDDLVAVQGTYPTLSVATRALSPQSAVTWELGVRGVTGPVEWNLTTYRAVWRNEILRLADAAGLPRGAVNAASTRHEGLEAGARWRLRTAPSRLTLTVTATVGRFRFVDDPVYRNNRIAGAPPQSGSAELLYELPRGFFAAAETTWLGGPIPVDHAGKLTYGGYGLAHARVGWKFGPRLTVFAGVRNLFDRVHVASTAGVLDLARAPASTSIFLPGPGRAFALGLEWNP
ncbi:MAG: TonB-dependent receptor [Verrucomicrobia bacterium]|nr:TonB-dependent receptor [Verrucomicrobiota bacterium]